MRAEYGIIPVSAEMEKSSPRKRFKESGANAESAANDLRVKFAPELPR